MLLALAAALPALFWDAGPEAVDVLQQAGVSRIAVPPGAAESWKAVPGISVEIADLARAVKLEIPEVHYLADQASASRAPWIQHNGWRLVRQPGAQFYYEVPGAGAALAAAEAFAYGAAAFIKTDTAGLKPFGEMQAFLAGVPPLDLTPVADFGFIDDGSDAAGEVMNLLIRYNLLFRPLRAPDRKFRLNVKLGTKQYPLEEAANPARMAHVIRADLTDERRSLRIYGTEVVVARLAGAHGALRIHLLNYDAASRKVPGIRVRVLGAYPKHRLAAAGSPGEELLDYTVLPDATEFTLPELKVYAVVDLSR